MSGVLCCSILLIFCYFIVKFSLFYCEIDCFVHEERIELYASTTMAYFAMHPSSSEWFGPFFCVVKILAGLPLWISVMACGSSEHEAQNRPIFVTISFSNLDWKMCWDDDL